MVQASRDKELVAAARALYLKYDGRQIRRIVAEIRAAGWPKFNSKNLYPSKSYRVRGWIERFGWKKELERKRKELQRKKRISEAAKAKRRATFEYWLRTVSPEMKWTARHFVVIREQLRRVTSGEVKRLMVFAPPRHGKSVLVTVRYALWRLIREPRMNIIIASYNQDLASHFSRKIRELARGRVKLSGETWAANFWETAAGGSVTAVGVGAGVNGYGGDLIILDDPVKNRAQANSPVFRERIWDWYNNDIYTRLEPGAAIILIQTRWHNDDLAGRLLKEMQEGGERWEVIRLSAFCDAQRVRSLN